MATDETEVVVLRDDDGALYVLNRERLQDFRVPKETQDAVEQALAGDEVTGYAAGTPVPVVSFSWTSSPNLFGSPLFCKTDKGKLV